MNPIEFVLPGEIEKRSFEIISEELEKRQIVLPKEQEPVTKRVIHTSADFDYAETMCYSCLLYTSPSPRDRSVSRMPSSA